MRLTRGHDLSMEEPFGNDAIAVISYLEHRYESSAD
jgi:hypothetical protein